MSDQKFSFSGTFQKAKEYVDTEIELLKLKAIAKGGRIIGALVLDVTKVVLLLIILFFFSLALGFFLGELMGSYGLGFLTTGGLFLVILLVIKIYEPKMEAKFMDMTIQKILGKWDEEEEIATGTSNDHDSTQRNENKNQ